MGSGRDSKAGKRAQARKIGPDDTDRGPIRPRWQPEEARSTQPRSSKRYCTASATCCTSMVSHALRSAMGRLSLSTR